MPPPQRDLYQSLGIEKDATPEAIRKAYRRKALQTHPDRLPQGATDAEIRNAAEEFRTVNNAYEVLNNEANRKLYDKHGVWPPPNVESQQPDPFDYFDAFGHRARHHNSSRPYGTYTSPFDEDPFFAGFNRRHDQFRFTDPFALFDQIFSQTFNDMSGFNRPASGPGFNPDPFFNHPFAGSSMFGPSPFESFFGQQFGFGGGSNANPFGFGNNNLIGFGGGGMNPMNPMSGGFSSFESSSSFGRNGSGMRSQSMEIRTQTVNGVTHTVKRKTDSNGNQHEERTYPDGRKEIFFNGVLQGSEHPKIEKTRHRDVPMIECPLDQNRPGAQTSEKHPEKKHWWRGW